MAWTIHHGDCRDVMAKLDAESVDAIVSDPPYGLSFMGKGWDHGVPGVEFWTEALRVAKPGAHLLAFGGTRTYHRLACAIEDADWEIRDCVMWVYGSGFPKSLDVSKAIDKRGGASVAWFGPWFRKWREENGIAQKQVAALFPSKSGGLTGCVANWELGFNLPTPGQFNMIRDTFGLPFDSVEEAEREVVGQRTTGIGTGNGSTPIMGDGNRDITSPATDAARQWQGWGTALKPAWEPIIVARKPLCGTVAENVLRHGTGAINVDGCRVEADWENDPSKRGFGHGVMKQGERQKYADRASGEWGLKDATQWTPTQGRWPANVIHDGSDEVVGLFPQAHARNGGDTGGDSGGVYSGTWGRTATQQFRDSGSAARFFYCAKASKSDREEGLANMPCRDTSLKYNGGDGFSGRTLVDGQWVNTDKASRSKPRNHHPTVKPTALMRYLCRLVTPPGGVVLDPFTGSGSTGKAAVLEGFGFVGIEREAEYVEIANARIAAAEADAGPLFSKCATH